MCAFFKIFLWIAGSVAVLIAVIFLAVVQPGGSGVIASKVLPDGSEYKVTQTCNWSSEPYTVSFYMRSPGQKWGWCYMDHEASRWRNASLSYDPNTDAILVKEDGKLQGRLDRKRKMFWRDKDGGGGEGPAPQDYREPPL